jgi:putative DNA primase/helicase
MKTDADKATEAARKAQELVAAAQLARTDHPYVARKQIVADGLREIHIEAARKIAHSRLPARNGDLASPTILVVPIYLDGELSTVELIDGDGRKHFLAGGKMAGGYWSAQPLPDCDWLGDMTIIIGEGVATVVSAAMATGYIGVAALSCGNLLAVGKMIRGRYPEAKIVFLADLGIGEKKCTEAARAVGGYVAVPTFPAGASGKDINDLLVAYGPEPVKACIYAAAKPAAEPASDGEPEHLDNTDSDHAARLWRGIKGTCHYIAERKTFAFYNAQTGVWKYDETGSRVLASTEKITAQLLDEARWYFDAAADCTDEKKREKLKSRAKSLQDEALQSKGLRFKKAAIELLRAQPGCEASSSMFDARGDLLNFQNGTLEMETGQFREHRKEDHLTVVIPRDFHQGVLAPRWGRFVDEVWTDPETRLLMKAWVGYCLSTAVKEQVFLYLWGIGANGKSIFARVLEALLGPYAVQCGIDMFIANDDAKTNRETINLKGKRLAICSETEEGRRLNEVLIKSIVSPDKQVGRRLYCEVETWEPTTKVMILGNHLMRTRGGSHATDRRIRLVGCEQVFEGENCDPGLLDKLMAELDGITIWAVEGYQQWKASGLPFPAKVKEDTAEYTAANDTLRPFFEDVCVSDRALETGRRKLYAAYIDWTRAQGEQHPLSPKSFSSRVQDRGFRAGPQKRIGKETDRVWLGIGLAADSPSQLSHLSHVTGKLLPIHPTGEGLSEIGVTSVTPVTGAASLGSSDPCDDGVLA